MSFPVIERTFAHTTQRGSFLAVLFFLADRADEHGVSWYGAKKIAAAVNLSPRQTRHILSVLRESGEIWYTPRFFADGSQTSNGYLVCCGLSVDAIRVALHHRELQLSDEGIDTALREIVTACGERVPDEASVHEAEVVPADAARVQRAHDVRLAVANSIDASSDHATEAALPNHAGTDNSVWPDDAPQWALAAFAAESGEPPARVADAGRPRVERYGAAPDARPPPNGTPPGIDADALWNRVLSDLQQSMPRDVFKTHLLGTSAEWHGDVQHSTWSPSQDERLSRSTGSRQAPPKSEPLLLEVRASPASVPWLVHRYQERAEHFAATHAGQPVAISFVGRTLRQPRRAM